MTGKRYVPRDEFSHWKDTGCDLFASCLECGLPACRYDMPQKAAAAWLRTARARDLLAQGLTPEEIAAVMGVSRRTVFRLKHGVASLEGRLLPIVERLAG